MKGKDAHLAILDLEINNNVDHAQAIASHVFRNKDARSAQLDSN